VTTTPVQTGQPLLRELITIPERIHQGDFVLRLTVWGSRSRLCADLGARCARSAGMIAIRVAAAALPDLPQAVEPAVVARSLVGV
jgi:hypothetical protein